MKYSLSVVTIFTLLSSLFAVSATAQSDALVEVGYVDLVALVGSSLEDGTGVTAAQAESSTAAGAYMPNQGDSRLLGAVFVDGTGTNVGSVGHATNVGARMYGSLSMAPGLGGTSNPITSFAAVDFLIGQTNFGSSRDPQLFDFDVANHSYILSQGANGISDAQATNLLQRLDFMVNQSETTMCVGVNNGAANPVPEFLAYTYNSLSVGVTSGNHSSGITDIYGAGRIKPEIVAPDSFTSYSTPLVTGAAALLHEAGSGTDATKSETMRALLLSGATKDEFTNWGRTTTQPLDDVFGAGELNIYNSYMSLKGGEFDGSTTAPSTSAGLNGWDYESEIVAGNDLFYKFEVEAGTQLDELSIALCWNMEIIDQSRFFFSPSENLGDLDLEFYDSSGSFLGSLIDQSKSAVDNVEHIYLKDLPAGTYHLKVSSDTNRDFGLAWRSTSSSTVLLGDINTDGVIDFLDITPFLILLNGGGYQLEADFDRNGFIDFLDITPFIVVLNNG